MKYHDVGDSEVSKILNKLDRVETPVKGQPIRGDEKPKVEDVKIVLSQCSRPEIIVKRCRIVFRTKIRRLEVLNFQSKDEKCDAEED